MRHLTFVLAVALTVVLLTSVPSTVAAQDTLSWKPFERALDTATQEDRPVLVHVHAPWCGWCLKMEREVYPALQPYLGERFAVARLQWDDPTTTHRYRGRELSEKELARRLGAEQVPAILLLASDGSLLLRLDGFMEADELRPVLRYIASEAYHEQSFEDFLQQSN